MYSSGVFTFVTKPTIIRILAGPNIERCLDRNLVWVRAFEVFRKMGVEGLTLNMFSSANRCGWTPESEPLRKAFASLLYEEVALEDYL